MNKFVGASLLALCFAAPAFAHDDMKMMDMDSKAEMKANYYMMKEDTNGDHMISKDEAMAFHTKMFKNIDTNNDGKISMDEKVAGIKKEMNDMHAMKDNTNEHQMDKGAKKAGAM